MICSNCRTLLVTYMSIDSTQILDYPIWYALHTGNQDNAYGGVYAKIIRRNMGALPGWQQTALSPGRTAVPDPG